MACLISAALYDPVVFFSGIELLSANSENRPNQKKAIKNHFRRLFIKIERPEACLFNFSNAKHQGKEANTNKIIQCSNSILSVLLVRYNPCSILTLHFIFLLLSYFLLKPSEFCANLSSNIH